MAAGLSQEELAERAGLSRRGISDLERGARRTPYPATLRRLTRALGLTDDDAAALRSARHTTPPASERSTAPHLTPRVPDQPVHADEAEHNLPGEFSSFVGRGHEVDEVQRLLATSRMVTLVGTGGVGKTRLALRVAAVIAGGFRDGVWLIDLAPLSSGRMLPELVAATLNLHARPGRSTVEVVCEALRNRALLLILDNCEHVIQACAELTDRLLRASHSVRVLATTRERLGLAGETVWRVPSLELPDPALHQTAAEILLCPSAQLFVDRALAVQPAFRVAESDVAALTHVLRRLDGIPLAIELAAARVRVLSVQQIAERLDQRFRLLTDGSRTALARQQTLAAAVGWSYELLSEPERLLFDRLSVFAGRFALDAVESICAGNGLEAADILELLTRLVDKSLVAAEDVRDARTWYRLLETLRQYGSERLATDENGVGVRAAHAAYYLGLAERAAADLWGPNQRPWLARLDAEADNLRAALRWSIDAGDVEQALRLCGALTLFWYTRPFPGEWRTDVEELVTTPAAAHPTLGRARVLTAAAALANQQGDYPAASSRAEEALTILRSIADPMGEAQAFWTLSHATVNLGEYSRARRAAEAGVQAAIAAGAVFWADRLRHVLAQSHYYDGDFAAAEVLLGLTSARNPTAGDFDWLGHCATARADFAAARVQFAVALAHRQSDGHRAAHAFTLCGLAALFAAEGSHVAAARLGGAAAALCEHHGMPPERCQQGGFHARMADARAALGDHAFDAAWAEGRELSLEQVVAELQKDRRLGQQSGGARPLPR
jgi:non-specific serine/threonine protein kinase